MILKQTSTKGRLGLHLVILIWLSSCASSYRNINPDKLLYIGKQTHDNVVFEYKYNVLAEGGNKKYAKKETKRRIQLVGVKVTNNGATPLSFRNDVAVYASDQRLYPLEPEIVGHQLKQNPASYLLYLLWWMNFGSCQGDDCNNLILPVGLPIGLGNMIQASDANLKFTKELAKNNLLSKDIQPGETMYGLVGFKATYYAPLRFEIDD